jgi:hypothetical protein
MGWGNAPYDDGVFGDDGFGDPSADCFGRAVEDIDPFGGNDSFDQDPDWSTEMDDDAASKPKARPSKSSTSSKNGSKNATKDRQDTHFSDLSPKRDKRSAGSAGKQTRRVDSVSNKKASISSLDNPATSGFGSFDNFASEESDFDPFSVGVDSSSVSSPSTTKNRAFRNGTLGDGFGDFVKFDAAHQNIANPRTGSPTHSSSSKNSSARSRRPTTAAIPRAPIPPSGRQRQRRNSLQEGSTGSDVFSSDSHTDGREYSPSTLVSPGGRFASGSTRVVHRKDGSATRLLPSEERRRSSNSGSRRSAVKDALFSSIGHDVGEADLDIPLSSYLMSDQTGRGAVRRGGENSSVGGHSTQSAPAADREHYRQRHRQSREHHQEHHSPKNVSSSEHNRDMGSNSPVAGAGSKSRRWNKKMASPSARDSRRSHSDGHGKRLDNVSIDVAQLAEQGYIEVVDGRMRLVVDLEVS